MKLVVAGGRGGAPAGVLGMPSELAGQEPRLRKGAPATQGPVPGAPIATYWTWVHESEALQPNPCHTNQSGYRDCHHAETVHSRQSRSVAELRVFY